MIQVPLNVSVGRGWQARRAQIPETTSSSIVLVTLGHDATERHVRVDVDKRILIDESPTVITANDVARIVERVIAARRAP